MTNDDWITNIEDAAGKAALRYGSEAVLFVFAKYGATCIADLSEIHYSTVYGELYLMMQDD